MKTRTIDKYISRATAGLPHIERIDTAAEIRVNLNLRIKELMLEGHPREEAEFLAIKDMGDAFTTNRALLGHAFTPRIGWVLVILAVLGISSWWLWQHRWDYFWGETNVRNVELNSKELEWSLSMDTQFVRRADYKKFEANLPRGTRSIEMLFVTPKYSDWTLLASNSLEQTVQRNPDSVQVPTKVSLIVWNGIPKSYTSSTSNIEVKSSSETHIVAAQLNPTISWSEPYYLSQKDQNGKPLQVSVPYSFSSFLVDGSHWATIFPNPNKRRGSSLVPSYFTDPQPIRLNKWTGISSYTMRPISSMQPTKPIEHLEVQIYVRATDKTMAQAKANRSKAKLFENVNGMQGFHALKPDGQPLLEKP